MDQQELMKAQFMHQQIQEMSEHLTMLDSELVEMSKYRENLLFLKDNKEKKVIASVGKGIHMSASLESDELLVEVGAGVVVKKTTEEALKIIDYQLEKLNEARIHLLGKLDIYQKTLDSIMQEIQNSQKTASN